MANVIVESYINILYAVDYCKSFTDPIPCRSFSSYLSKHHAQLVCALFTVDLVGK